MSFFLVRLVTESKLVRKCTNIPFKSLNFIASNPSSRFLQCYKKTRHHADRGYVASWSRSLTPCPSLAEDCSTNQLARLPGPSPTPRTFVTFGPSRSVVLLVRNGRRQRWKKAARTRVLSSSRKHNGGTCRVWNGTAFPSTFSSPTSNDHITGTLAVKEYIFSSAK